MEPKYEELKRRLIEINDLTSSAALLHWDQSTYMPAGGAEARGRQIGTLTKLSHEKFIDPAIGELLEDLKDFEKNMPYESEEASLVRVTRREYEREVKVPSEFAAEFSNHQSAAYGVWIQARPANDFGMILPYLEKTLEMSRQYANYFPGYEHIADPLIDVPDYGVRVSELRPLFAKLREVLVPLVQAITCQPAADTSCLHQYFSEPQQLAFGRRVIERLGYDFHRGREDKTHHPFMTKFSLGDVRITTRVREDFFGESLFSTMHEAGHALYEQGIAREFEGTPLASGTSSGVHESQSRLWENLVGRSRGFWEYFYPQLQEAFPSQFKMVTPDQFYRAINQVQRSLIRTDADEVTYNLHVMIRFGLEMDLLEGKLAVRDLPEAWRERYTEDLGIRPADDKDGVLQDMHWYVGTIGGMFQCYTLGNILSAQIFDAAVRARPGIPEDIRQGRFETLHGWLRENLYRYGSMLTASEIVPKATGSAMTIEPYVRYLKEKFGEMYRI